MVMAFYGRTAAEKLLRRLRATYLDGFHEENSSDTPDQVARARDGFFSCFIHSFKLTVT